MLYPAELRRQTLFFNRLCIFEESYDFICKHNVSRRDNKPSKIWPYNTKSLEEKKEQKSREHAMPPLGLPGPPANIKSKKWTSSELPLIRFEGFQTCEY